MTEEVRKRIELINSGCIPKDYKKSEIGIIPIDWEEKKLKDIGKFTKGKGLPGTEMKSYGVPCVGYGDIYTKYNYKFDKTFNFVDKKVADESMPISKGALLFTCSGETALEIGKCVCYNGEETIYAGGDIAILNIKKAVSPLFVGYQQNIFSSIKQKARFGQGHSVVHIYGESLGKLGVAYPTSKNEQNSIVSILSIWDDMIMLQRQLIKKLELKRTALVQRLIKPKNDWKLVHLKKILKERKTYSPKGEEFTHVTLSKQGVCDKTDQYNRDFLVASDEKGYKITHYNDLCYNPANLKFGVICLNKYGDAIFSPIYVTFEISSKYNCDFIGAILTSQNFVRKIRRFEEGSLYERQAVKPVDFVRDSILIPDYEEQEKIANIINMFDKKVELEIEKLDSLEKQRKVMQHLLLTGIVRI